MSYKSAKAHGIIHTASASAAVVGAGLAQVPGSDNAFITPIQITMLIALAHLHGVTLTRGAAAAKLSFFAAAMVGRAASQALVGWIPGYGNAINATTAATITQAIGWSVNSYFESPQ